MSSKKSDWQPVRHLEDLLALLASLIIRVHVILLQADSHGSFTQIFVEASEGVHELTRMQAIYADHWPQVAALVSSPNGRLDADLARLADYLKCIEAIADRHGNYDYIYLNAAQCFTELGHLRDTLSDHWYEAVDLLRDKYDTQSERQTERGP